MSAYVIQKNGDKWNLVTFKNNKAKKAFMEKAYTEGQDFRSIPPRMAKHYKPAETS